MRQPLLGGAATALSSDVGSFVFRDGVAVWTENVTGGPKAIKAWSAAQGILTLGTESGGSSLLNAGSGFGLYQRGNAPAGQYTVNGATGASQLRIEGGPFGSRVTGNWVYLKVGAIFYRYALN